MIGTPGFFGERLEQARRARGMTATALADLLEVSTSNITLYESGKQSPSREVMERIVLQLRMPRDFFLKPVSQVDRERIYYRSMSAATKTARLRAEARFEWLKEIVAYLRKYLDFPSANFPDFTVPDDPREITTDIVEDLAAKCREYYRLGIGPIPDVLALLESN